MRLSGGGAEASAVDDDVVSELRHMAAANSISSGFRTCFINENIIDALHITVKVDSLLLRVYRQYQVESKESAFKLKETLSN